MNSRSKQNSMGHGKVCQGKGLRSMDGDPGESNANFTRHPSSVVSEISVDKESTVPNATDQEPNEVGDAMHSYFKQLANSDPLSPEDEYDLWSTLDHLNMSRRRELYRFGFVLQEHIKLLTACDGTNINDYFPYSSFPEQEHKTNSPEVMLLYIKPWKKEIQDQYERLRRAYHEKDVYSDAQQAAIDLLMRYPVQSELLNEWSQVANIYRMSFENEWDTAPKEELSQIQLDIEEKILMGWEEFTASMALLEYYDSEIQKVKEKILTANLRLVVSLVKFYRDPKIQPSDLIQEGNLGLIHALERFDYKLGHKFSTYATWWIKRYILKSVASQSRVIRLPTHMLQAISKINKTEQNFILTHGRDPSDEELAEILELTRERVSSIKRMACQTISLQAPVSEDENSSTLLESLSADNESDDPVRQLAYKMMCSRLGKVLEHLTEREQQIIRMRFGLNGKPPKTLIEVSKYFGLTRERIRQLEFRAIKKLRDPSLIIYFKDYFG